MITATLEGNLREFDAEAASRTLILEYEKLWARAIARFLEVLMADIPYLSGGTFDSLLPLAFKYNADIPAKAMSHPYNWWPNWEHHFTQPAATDDLDVQLGGAIMEWSINIPAVPFQMNEGATNYIIYWIKDAAAKQIPWTNRETGIAEPWNLLPFAKAEMLEILRRETPKLLDISVRGGFKGRVHNRVIDLGED